MGRHTSLLYQLVYSTKYRTPCLHKEMRKQLFSYMWGILKNKKCHLYRMNGVEDHLHIITDIHPTLSISGLVKDLKLTSSNMIKNENLIVDFPGWQIGYGAFSYAMSSKDYLIDYVKNQEEHHKQVTFREEYIALLVEHGIEYDERYLFED